MTPGTLILLGGTDPLADAPLAEALRARGHAVLVPESREPATVPHRYVAARALAINAAAPAPPLVLVARGEAGPLLPALAVAQRAAKRAVHGYVLIDTELPEPGGDWPDAPCAYLATSPGDPRVKQASLRAWQVVETTPDGLAADLDALLGTL